jgi:capsular polysaccharide biosynthesis protein
VRFSLSLLGRWLPVVALTAVGAAAAAGYAYTAADRYQATSQLIVSPVSSSDPTYLGLGLLRDTGGKRTAAASAAVMLRSPQVADAVRTELGLTRSRDSLLAALHAHAVGASDIVDVTVQDTSAVRAAQLANAFANALVSQRTASFQSQLTTAIRRTEEELQALPPNQRTTGAGADLQQRLTVLRSLQGSPDPTIRPADQAEAPTSAIWPNRPLIAGIGAGAGLVLGLIVVAILALTRRRPRDAAPAKAAAPRSVDLRAAGAAASPDLSRQQRELEERTAVVAAREQQADAKAEQLERRTTELEERAGVLERRTAELETRTEARAMEAEDRQRAEREASARKAAEREAAERAAAEREAAERETAQREAAEREAAEQEAAERAAAERAAAAREAAEREAAEREEAERAAAARAAEEQEAAARAAEAAAQAAQAAQPEPVLPGVPVYRADAPVNGVARGHWNLTVLERLVEERGGEFPERIDEWASYLFFLRDYAEPDGSVPASFDWLIEDEFAELV